MSRWLGIVAACRLASGIAATGLLLTGAAVADTSPSGLGINAQWIFGKAPAATWDTSLGTMYRDGIRTVRTDASWNDAEPSAPDAGGHHYRWNKLDAIVASLAAHGMRWLPVADYSAAWAASAKTPSGQADLFSAPHDPMDYAAYVGALATRYGSRGGFWLKYPALPHLPITGVEIWNEENGWYWHPSPNALAYARLYEDARSAAHAADPRLSVIIGGLSAPSGAFLHQIYAAIRNRPGLIDAVGLHPYASKPDQTLDEVTRARYLLDQAGDVNAALDVTEFGWPTAGLNTTGLTVIPPVSDRARAGLLTQLTQSLARSDCDVERITPYTWTTAERDPLNPEDWFGIVHPDGTPSLTADAYAGLLPQLESAPAPPHASNVICSRPLSLGLRQIAAAHARRHRTSAPVRCVQATVTSRGAPVSGARVLVGVQNAKGVARQAASAWTDGHGEARACWRLGPRDSAVVDATASRTDFYSMPSTTVRLRGARSS